jgi:hypothetical protein
LIVSKSRARCPLVPVGAGPFLSQPPVQNDARLVSIAACSARCPLVAPGGAGAVFFHGVAAAVLLVKNVVDFSSILSWEPGVRIGD